MRPHQISPAELDHLLALDVQGEDRAGPPDSSLLRLLATIDRALLNEVLTEHIYQAGEVLFWEGEDGDAMYLIRSGQVMVLKGDLDAPAVLGLRGPGEIIGEMAMLEKQPRSASNIVLQDARLLRIDRAGFQQLTSAYPEISMNIMATLSARLRDADNVRTSALEGGRRLVQQVTRLQSEKEHLLELQRVRRETSDLIVHDLRNPLSTIYGALHMLEVVLPEDVLADNREILDLAMHASERMQRLVDSLLDVSKLETGEMLITLAPTHIKPLLEDAVRRQSIPAQTHNVAIHTDIPDDLPPVLLDRDPIERVLANLLDNALKYTPAGETIVVAAEQDGVKLVISVIDAGPGIPPEDRERIFERFAQVSGSQARRRGFGLGLTFCQLTVEAHDGTIWVEPGPGGVGSRFAFTLPVHVM